MEILTPLEVTQIIAQNETYRADLKLTKDTIVQLLKILGMIDDKNNVTKNFKIRTVMSFLSDLAFKSMTSNGQEEIKKDFGFMKDAIQIFEKYKNL